MEPSRTFIGRSAPLRFARGFSLVEMLVVISIISIVTTVALVGNSSFDKSLLLTETAYRVALSVRQMQNYGLSSRTFSGSTNIGYGAHFSSASPGSYVLFADTSPIANIPDHCEALIGTAGTPDYKLGDCIYTAGSDGLVETYSFTRGFTVSDFCGRAASGGTRYCMSTNGLSALDAVFMRPNTDSVLSGQRTSAGSPWIELSSAEIYLSTADSSAHRAVCISKVGQISVAIDACP